MSLIYAMTCAECGCELLFTCTLDGEQDLCIVVEPCEVCAERASSKFDKLERQYDKLEMELGEVKGEVDAYEKAAAARVEEER